MLSVWHDVENVRIDLILERYWNAIFLEKKWRDEQGSRSTIAQGARYTIAQGARSIELPHRS